MPYTEDLRVESTEQAATSEIISEVEKANPAVVPQFPTFPDLTEVVRKDHEGHAAKSTTDELIEINISTGESFASFRHWFLSVGAPYVRELRSRWGGQGTRKTLPVHDAPMSWSEFCEFAFHKSTRYVSMLMAEAYPMPKKIAKPEAEDTGTQESEIQVDDVAPEDEDDEEDRMLRSGDYAGLFDLVDEAMEDVFGDLETSNFTGVLEQFALLIAKTYGHDVRIAVETIHKQ